MTDVQRLTYRPTYSGRDVLAKSLTGSGKTLSFLVPLVQRLIDTPANVFPDRVSVLVLSPVRELAQQIGESARKLAKGTDLRVNVVIGGGGKNGVKELGDPKHRIDIQVATPATLIAAIKKNDTIKKRLSEVKTLVLDETDEMLSNSFRPSVSFLVRSVLPKAVQMLFYSATMSKEYLLGIDFVSERNPVFVDTVGDLDVSVNTVVQSAHVLPTGQHPSALLSIITKHANQMSGGRSSGAVPDRYSHPDLRLDAAVLQNLGTWNDDKKEAEKGWRVMVFCQTNDYVELVSKMLARAVPEGVTVLSIGGNMDQTKRTRASDAFRAKARTVLVSTDASARGLDYPGVTLVAQLGFTDRASYLQRLGRTARAGAKGEGVLLVDPTETPALSLIKDQVSATPFAVPPHALTTSSENPKFLKSVYRSWLGYVAGRYKALKYDRQSVLKWSLDFAADLGLEVQPEWVKKKLNMGK